MNSASTATSAFLAAHPRITELRERRAACIEHLRSVLLELQHLKNHELPHLLDEYDTHFHSLEIALQTITLTAAESGRREELFRIKLERGEILTERMIEVVNTIVDREFARVKKRLHESFSMTAEEREREANDRAERHNASDFVKLYRAIVKKLHPDAADTSVESTSPPSSQTHFEQFWQTAQDAYAAKNAQQLQSVYDIVCLADDRADEHHGALPTEEYLTKEINRLEHRLRSEQRRVRDIVQNPPYTLREQMKSQTWLEAKRAKLETQIAEKKREAQRSQDFLISIHAHQHDVGWKLSEQSEAAKEQESFTNDFMESTYFSRRG
jgi:hypothetical protein